MLGAWKVSFIIINVDKGIMTAHIKRLAWTQDYEVGMYDNRSFTIYLITDITCQYFFLSIAVDWTSNYRGRGVCVRPIQ